jgi:hypothetical protein
MPSTSSPAGVDNSFGRWPLRWVTRVGVRSPLGTDRGRQLGLDQLLQRRREDLSDRGGQTRVGALQALRELMADSKWVIVRLSVWKL